MSLGAGATRAHADRGEHAYARASEPLALLSKPDAEDDDAPRERANQDHHSSAHGRSAQSAEPEASTLVHRMTAGETLSAVAKHYGVSLQQIVDLNPGLNPDRVREGQNITLGGERTSVRYTVQPGDSLTSIAKAHEVSLNELVRWNPKLNPDRIRSGQGLSIYPKKPLSLSESMGAPASGQLLYGSKLPPGPGYVVRSPERAYATDETVRGIIEAFRHFHLRDPKAPQLFIHDLSLRRGGPMTEHHSHQSGRDADIAYPQKHCDGVCDFRHLAPGDLDAPRAFALLRYWLEHDMLEAVFIDYRLQLPLYQYARSQGATAEQLHRWFQYPNGPGSPLGVIRHYPKHDDHMHVRFMCPANDPECKTYRPLLTRTASR